MRVGLLNAYHFDGDPESYQTAYAEMFRQFLHQVDANLEILVYEVPTLEKLPDYDECDGWIIGGSAKSAYDADQWIQRLQEWVRQAHQQKKKIVGVCFGHQLIAQALGGRVEKASQGWGVGARRFSVEGDFPWVKSNTKKPIQLLFSHQDQVVQLPVGGERLATDSFCPIQMFKVADNIFCLQGHPEFSKQFMRLRLEARAEIIGKSTYDRAIASLAEPTDHIEVGRWLINFFQK